MFKYNYTIKLKYLKHLPFKKMILILQLNLISNLSFKKCVFIGLKIKYL